MEQKTYKFQDVCETITDYVANGSFKSLADNVQYSDTKDYARLIRLVDFNNNYDEKNAIWVPESSYKFLKKSALYGSEIIISNVGANLGTVFKCPKLGYPMTLGPNAILAKTNVICNQNYLYYYLKSKIGYSKLMALVSGSAMPKFNKTDLRNMEISLPDRSYQDKAAELLLRIDDKIELNNKINNNLFNLVLNDFNDFLDKNIDAEIVKLEDCVEKINTGADAIQRAPIVDYDTGIRCIRIGDMTNGRDYHSWGFTKMTDKDFENYKLIRNDIVITRTAVNGLTYMITDEENTVCNNGNIRLRVNKKYNPLYIYLNTKTNDFRNYIDRINGETSVRPNMKVEYFTNYEIKKIDLEKQNAFCLRAESIMKKIQNNKVENYNLEQLRETLLPKLINGEIDLDNIEI